MERGRAHEDPAGGQVDARRQSGSSYENLEGARTEGAFDDVALVKSETWNIGIEMLCSAKGKGG